jgi:hypothetical protein
MLTQLDLAYKNASRYYVKAELERLIDNHVNVSASLSFVIIFIGPENVQMQD